MGNTLLKFIQAFEIHPVYDLIFKFHTYPFSYLRVPVYLVQYKILIMFSPYTAMLCSSSDMYNFFFVCVRLSLFR